MPNNQLCSICTFYAISPVHAGSGAAISTVDLPIQRERHTNWPHIQASGVKGAFRAHFRENTAGNTKELINLIFGSDDQDGWMKELNALSGAISISDARLLAFPIRSSIAPFVWVTSPQVLKRWKSDFAYIGSPDSKTVDDILTKATNLGEIALSIGIKSLANKQVILEEAVVSVGEALEFSFFKNHFPELEQVLLVSDELFEYAVSYCTEVQTNIKIDTKTGTADDGALRYQEFLPSDSVLYSVVYFNSRELAEISVKRDKKTDDERLKKLQADIQTLQAATLKKHIEDSIKGFIQIGGDATLGKGIFKINWISNQA